MHGSGDNSQAPELPLLAYRLIAQILPLRDLAALQKASKALYQAANTAVYHFGSRDRLWLPDKLSKLPVVVVKFPNLITLDLSCVPPSYATHIVRSLMGLSSLQNVGLYYSVAAGATGWELLRQQTALRSLTLFVAFSPPREGIRDSFLSKVVGLRSLVKLELPLSSLATTEGVGSLSMLSNLQSLSLSVWKYEAAFTGKAVTAFTGLTQLTYLSLMGWPIQDSDVVVRLTCLQKLQHVDFSDCQALSCLCFMPLLNFPLLHSLAITRGDEWLIDAIVDMFCRLKPLVSLQL